MNNDKYKNVTIQGSIFPDAPISNNRKITLSKEINEEYIPTLNALMKTDAYGFRLLLTIMAHQEGFFKGSRSYKTHNPGNIGNTDSGLNTPITNLEQGIIAQRNYFLKIINGKHSSYPMNNRVVLKPFYSKEIANNPQYGLPCNLPGYDFIFTGQLDQFVKIYSTGARGGNGYLSTIISFFHSHGVEINAQSKIQDIIKIKK